MRNKQFLLIVAFSVGAHHDDRCLGAETYLVIDLGLPQHPDALLSEGIAINDRDAVIINGSDRGGQFPGYATLISALGNRILIPSPGCPGGVLAGAINDANVVAGQVEQWFDSPDCGFVWNKSAGSLPLGIVADFVDVLGVNDAGVIAVDYMVDWDHGPTYQAYRWRSGDFEAMPDFDSAAWTTAINNSEQVSGAASVRVNGSQDERAVLWTGDEVEDLGTLGGRKSWAHGLNELGTVVGWSAVVPDSNVPRFPFVWEDGVMTALADDPGEARGINDAGEIVGYVESVPGQGKAVLWRDGATYVLNDLIDPDLGWDLYFATDINNAGRIVGTGTNPEGQTRAYMLIPNEFRVAGPIPGLAGRENVLRAVGAEPNKRVYFIYGFAAGNGEVPGCPGLFADIAQPILAGFADADASGEALLGRNVPASASGAKIIFQAVQRNSCQVARAVWHKFPR